MATTTQLLTKNYCDMRRVGKFVALVITVLAGYACYFTGDKFLMSGDQLYFWIHVSLAVWLTFFLPKLILGNERYNIGSGYILELIIGIVWGYWNIFSKGTSLSCIFEMGKYELLLLDAAILAIGGMVAMIFVPIPQDD